MARLQKRAWYGLIVSFLWIIALVVTFISKGGIDTFVVDQGFEALMVGMMVVGFLAYFITLLVTRGKHGEVTMDERDRAILAKARATQLWATVVILAVWMVSLGRFYWDQGQVPVQYLYIIFMSTILIVITAENVGILLGYRGTVNLIKDRSKGG